MARNLFLLMTVAASAILYACGAPQQTIQGGGAPTRVSCAGSDTFLGNVYVLTLPFFPSPNSDLYQPPNGTLLTALNAPNIKDDLSTAFCYANPRTQNDFLGLTKVFINPCSEAFPNDCGNKPMPAQCDPKNCSAVTPAMAAANSWGYRDRNDRKYIAISAGLWQNGSHAPPFDFYEQQRIQAALVALATQYGSNTPLDPSLLPTYDLTSPANDSAVSVLAALAHERGHVLWWEKFVPKPGGPYMPNPNFCNNIFYPNGLWKVSPDVPNNRWIQFAETSPRYIIPGSDIDNLGKFLSIHDRKALKYLDNIYSGKKWASVLAAFSPDEEFVEAYQLSALAYGNVKLKNLEIVIPGQNRHDLPSTLDTNSASFDRNSVLFNQTQCFLM